MIENPFQKRGIWLKASLHTHSAASDGLLPPEGVVRYYSRAGYDVISITDHNKLTKVNKFNDVIIIPGIEASVIDEGKDYHLILLGVRDDLCKFHMGLRKVVDLTLEHNSIVIIAHPYWSNLGCEDLVKIKGCTAIEIYNTACDVEVGRGESNIYWDYLLACDFNVWGVAVDDAHKYTTPPIDSLGGWIWVKVAVKEEEEVLKAIRKGSFYSTMGPCIENVELRNEKLVIKCEPMNKINIISAKGRGLSMSIWTLRRFLEGWRRGDQGIKSMVEEVTVDKERGLVEIIASENVTIEVHLDGDGIKELTVNGVRKLFQDYIRVEIVDREGKKAWSNPMRL